MKTKTIKIYEFKELKKEIQKKVLDTHRFINIDYEQWDSELTSEYERELGQIGFEFADIRYSGFSSQGDGLSFDATVNLEMILKYLKYPKREINRAMKLQELECLQLDINKTSFTNHYSHEYVGYVDNIGYRDVEKMISVFKADELIDKIEKDVEDLRVELCKKYYKLLEKEYYHLIEDEQIIAMFEANDDMFDSKGNIQ